jgi:isoleucyl-tRNA synthetase
MDYRATLNLPKTLFPMRANLPEREPDWLKQWQEMQLYSLARQAHRGCDRFILHDGPPYANGDIHTGTALNKLVKDMINRYFSLQGLDTPYVPGWDTHGLPIELRALKQLGVSQHEIDPITLRAECAKVARHFIPLMTEEFERLGILADWDHPYVTMDPSYEADELRMFAAMVEKDLIYRDRMPVYWCSQCETALAEAEIEYHEGDADAVIVAFALSPRAGMPDGVRALIWTTTPWTLPANVAIALNPTLPYVVVETALGHLLLAEDRVSAVLEELGVEAGRRWGPFFGKELEGWVAKHPYLDRPSPLILGDHVTQDSGTGLVHTAPGHGLEDYVAALRYQLPMIQPLNSQGIFTEEAPEVAGLFYRQGNERVLDLLRRENALLKVEAIRHQNTFCWRCKSPVIYRATSQWFMSIDKVRDGMMDATETVKWDPGWGKDRIGGMVRDRRDWCLSRQRAYGVPIPAFYCEQCNHALLSADLVRSVADLVALRGSDVWWLEPAQYFLPADMKCPVCGHQSFRKEKDVFDVWMDSGASQQVLERREELRWPADLILEGNDQYRGWFMALLTEGVAVHGSAPYRGVLTHGWVLDQAGQEMHKSLGNTIDPLQLIDRYGADILRLWVASSEYRTDVRISDDLMKQMAETYRKFRNTVRFLLGNLGDYQPKPEAQADGIQDPLNRWAMAAVDRWLEGARQAYQAYQFHSVVHGLIRLVTIELSSLYLDVIKDRLYTLAVNDGLRRETQAVLHHILTAMVLAMSPILVFTAEEIYQMMPLAEDRLPSVHLASWPKTLAIGYSEDEKARMDRVLRDRDIILKTLEGLRESKAIGNSLEAEVLLTVPRDEAAFGREQDAALLTEVTMTVKVDVVFGEHLSATAVKTENLRCERCWRYTPDVGQGGDPGLCRRCQAVLAVEESLR